MTRWDNFTKTERLALATALYSMPRLNRVRCHDLLLEEVLLTLKPQTPTVREARAAGQDLTTAVIQEQAAAGLQLHKRRRA